MDTVTYDSLKKYIKNPMKDILAKRLEQEKIIKQKGPYDRVYENCGFRKP